MTTTIPTDNRNILNEADAITGWTATDGPTLYTASPTPMEASGCLSMQVSNETQNAYITITSDDYSGGGTISVWIQDRAEFNTSANTGIGIVVGDGTNRIAYSVGGSDGTAFRHDTGPVKWACFLLDLANKPANFVTLAGSEANLNEAAITQVGVYFETLVKSVGGADNVFWDIIRFADNGDDVIIQGGTTSGAAGNGSEAAVVDRSTGNQQAYGVIRELANGVYGIQGNLTIGNAASSSDQYWTESNVTYAWEDRGLSSNNYYRFKLVGSSTATNCEFSFTATTFTVPSGASASFDGNGADITVCTMDGCTFIGFDQGVETSDDTGDSWAFSTFISCGTIVANGCDLSGSAVSGYEGTADTSALSYNLTVDPDGELDDMSFTKGTAATHAIEFGTSVPSSMTLRGIDFSGYNAADGQNDSTFEFLDTSGTITLNLVGCTGNVSVKKPAGLTVIVVNNPVTLEVTCRDQVTKSAIEGVAVTVRADDVGPYPYQDSVTITQTSGTATVSHTGHGLSTGQKVEIEGADQNEYNRIKTITVTGPNAYTYTVPSGTTSPATGTITSTAVIIDGETNASGIISDTRVYSSDQDIEGYAAKGTRAPLYVRSPIANTVDNANGLALTVLLVSDE